MPRQFTYAPDGQLAIGSPAPPFDLPGVDGKNYTLQQYRNKSKGLAVIFSCNHCPWVIKNEDRMIALAREYQPRGVPFVLISVNDVVKYPQDSFDNMRVRAKAKGYPFPYLYNEDQQVARAFGALVTPHVFLFDGDFILRYRGAIDDNPDLEKRPSKEHLREAMDAILRGEAERITTSTTRAVGCSVKWK